MDQGECECVCGCSVGSSSQPAFPEHTHTRHHVEDTGMRRLVVAAGIAACVSVSRNGPCDRNRITTAPLGRCFG